MAAKITNTKRATERNPGDFLEEAICVGTGAAIEGQEAAGQVELVNSAQLPGRMLTPQTRPALEAAGVIFGAMSGGDDLFLDATLPAGWKKVASDHSMWSDLVDDKGRKRASIFYKAAFYDRSAHIRASPRFTLESDFSKETDASGLSDCRTHVKDGAAVLFTTPWFDNALHKAPEWKSASDLARAAAAEWLRERYPDFENPAAYWDLP